MSLLRRKEIDAKFVAGIGMTGLAIPNTSSLAITSQLTTRLLTAGRGGGAVRLNPSNNPEVDGVVVDTARNIVRVVATNGQDILAPATGRLVYGRITESAGSYTLAFRTWDGTTEAAYAVNQTVNIKLPYNYLLKDIPETAFFDTEVFGGLSSLPAGSLVGGRGIDVNSVGGVATIISQPDTANLTDAATIAWDLANHTIAKVTLGGDRTLANPTSKRNDTFYLVVTQDGTGNRKLAFGTDYKFSDNTPPILSTGAGQTDVLAFVSDGTSMFLIGKTTFAGAPATTGGGMKIIRDIAIPTDATTINITGLDGNVDKRYQVVIRIPYSISIEGGTLLMRYNNQTSNYVHENIPNAFTGIMLASAVGTYYKTTVLTEIPFAETGQERVSWNTQFRQHSSTSPINPNINDVITGREQYGKWTDTTTNITSITIASGVIGGIPAGTVIRLYALRP